MWKSSEIERILLDEGKIVASHRIVAQANA